MPDFAVTFLIIAPIAGILGFDGIAGTADTIARVLLPVFLVLFLLSLVCGGKRAA